MNVSYELLTKDGTVRSSYKYEKNLQETPNVLSLCILFTTEKQNTAKLVAVMSKNRTWQQHTPLDGMLEPSVLQ
jgi:hypothetical protein